MPVKKTIVKKEETVKPIEKVYDIEALIERITKLEELFFKPVVEIKKLNKTEKFYQDEMPDVKEDSNIRMGEADKIISMQNAIKILPPNMIVEGRHAKENIEAICGFKISDEMMDEAYKDIVHEA